MDTSYFSKKKKSFFTSQNLFVSLFFVALLSIGSFTYPDYGISWDEPIGKTNGAISALHANYKLDYLLLSEEKVERLIDKFGDNNKEQYRGATSLHEYKDKDYGVIFEFYLAAVQFLMDTTDEKSVYQLRHFLTFVFFSTGVLLFYFLGIEIFKNYKLALLACLFLVLSPRIFAHSFYNSKDIPFMTVYIWSLYTMLKFLKEKRIKWAILHAITSATLIAIRIPGIIIPAITLCFLLLDEILGVFVWNSKKQRWSAYTLYFVLSSFLVVLFWPYLWEDPLGNFVASFHNFSRFRSDTHLLFWGQIVWTKELPWYYTFSWMLITIPILYTVLFLTGGVFLISDVLKKIRNWAFYRCEATRNKLLVTVTFLGPLMAILIFNSVLYNGWRHSYFIYPPMLIIAVSTLPKVMAHSKQLMGTLGKKLVIATLATYVVYMAITIFQFHPYQQDYFNFIAGKSIEQNFDLDYWGLSCKEGIDYLLEEEKADSFSIGARITYPVILNTNNFTKEERSRIQINHLGDRNDYLFIRSNERYKFPAMKSFDLSNYEKIKVISAAKTPLLEIYKAKANIVFNPLSLR